MVALRILFPFLFLFSVFVAVGVATAAVVFAVVGVATAVAVVSVGFWAPLLFVLLLLMVLLLLPVSEQQTFLRQSTLAEISTVIDSDKQKRIVFVSKPWHDCYPCHPLSIPPLQFL